MKQLLWASAALLALAVPAVAQSPNSAQTTATIGVRCSMTNNATQTFNNLVLADGTGQLIAANVTSINTTLSTAPVNVACNAAGSTLTLTRTPLTRTPSVGSVPNGLTEQIDFTATATPAGRSAITSATATPQALGLFNGAVTLAVANPTAGGNRLVAGAYAGSVVLTLTPNS